MRAIADRSQNSARLLIGFAALAMVLITGCATTPEPKPQPAPSPPKAEQAWCASSCPSGYQCSGVQVAGVLTGLCVAGPTQCTNDADCLKVSYVPGTQPIRYICDKHSGGFPDKTGAATTSVRGTCMPGPTTGLEGK